MLSLASGTQEATAGLVNFNLDFAMLRVDAPPEFKNLGGRLSRKRKSQAEDGPFHVTARKLGALFDEDLPTVPNLTRAYGLRASEIAGDPALNPVGSVADGPLRDHVGIDGTSVWAAATSGRGALQVHLLACILARVWSSPEAVSIWSELIATRKSILQERLRGNDFSMNTVTAAQIDLSRDKLAEWDSSARAVGAI